MRGFRSHWCGLIFCSFLFLTLPLAAFANDYYVSATGSDSNNGSQGSPWRSIQKATSAFTLGSSGTVIHVAAGTYTAPDITRGGASNSARLVIQCDAGVASASAAQGQCRITNDHILIEAGNIDMVGFDVGNNSNMNVAFDVICPSNSGSGQLCPAGPNVRIIGNYIHDLGASVNAGSAVGCSDAGAINEVSHGYRMTGNKYIGNFILNFGAGYPSPVGGNCGWGIDLDGTDAVVQNNIIINVPTGGIGSHAACNLVISNNVIIKTTDAIVPNSQHAGTMCPNGVGHNTFANNYSANVVNHYYQSGGASACTSSNPSLYSHNITDGSGNDFNPPRTGCDTVNPSPMTHQAPSAYFVQYQASAAGDFHLSANSAGLLAGSTQCVAGGISPCTPSTDIVGVVRGSPLSVGAYETQQAGSVPSPPTGLTAQVQ